MFGQRKKLYLLTLLLAITAVLIAAWFWSYNSSTPSLAEPGINALEKPLQLEKFSLTDSTGQVFDNDSLKEKWSLLFFGYTHCPDICSNTLSVINVVHNRWTTQKKIPLQVIFVSLDPHRDTKKILKEYASYFNPAFVAATAPTAKLNELTSQIGAFYEYEYPGTGEVIKDVTLLPVDSKYAVHHIASLYVFNSKGHLVAEILPPPDIERTMRGLTKLFNFYGS